MKNSLWTLLFASQLAFIGCSTEDFDQQSENQSPAFQERASTTQNSNTFFGDPSGSRTDSQNNLFMEKTGYSLSYNRSKAHSNWVAWHLDTSNFGSTPRQDDFRSDTSLPSTYYRATGSEYSGTGFDKGHLCPSADRTTSISRNSETFLMTNIFPQAPKNNQTTWGGLEDYTRTLVNQGKEVYIYAGTYGTGGSGSNGGTTNTIGSGNINVPARCWKVILVLDNGGSDITRVSSTTRVIAVNMPNTHVINSDWKTYRVSVDSLEQLLGYDFFTKVSTTIQSSIESRVDNL
jgi:endonuclease G, mitochondrial